MATRGWQGVTQKDLTARDIARVRSRTPQVTRSKYRAIKETVDNIVFHSQAEARRYRELKCLQAAGKIFRLELQPRYRLCAFTNRDDDSYLGEYVADFRYCNTAGCVCAWGCTVEDVKGFKTPLYRWKKKHFEKQYHMQIREM